MKIDHTITYPMIYKHVPFFRHRVLNVELVLIQMYMLVHIGIINLNMSQAI